MHCALTDVRKQTALNRGHLALVCRLADKACVRPQVVLNYGEVWPVQCNLMVDWMQFGIHLVY
jgi:hypothetical protein